MSDAFIYCPRCGAPLAEGFAFGQARRLCRYCGFILFRDPKVAVGGLVSDGERILMVRRGSSPGLGLWALPAGYMDDDEMPEDTLLREVREETGLSVEPLRLEGIVPLAGWREKRGILLIYRCRLLAVDPSRGSEQIPAPADDATRSALVHARRSAMVGDRLRVNRSPGAQMGSGAGGRTWLEDATLPVSRPMISHVAQQVPLQARA